MSPLRVWIDHEQAPACKPGAHVKLSADESAHVVRSLRARRGDAVVLLDGEGLVVEGKLASADGDGAMVEVVRARVADPLSPAIYVAQGMPKGGTMDDLVRICCEAGAAGVIPLETARCEVKLDADRAAAKQARWTQQAAEACKQSGNPWQATIAGPRKFDEWLATLPPGAPGELRLTGSLEVDAEPVGRVDFNGVQAVTWLIGPEGDLTADELAAAAKQDPAAYRAALLQSHPRALRVLQLAAAKSGWGAPLEPTADGRPRARGMALHAAFGSIVAEVAEVSVARDGRIRVHRVVAAIDCGLAVNPNIIAQQIESGIIDGLSVALNGELVIEDGAPRQSNFYEYRLLRIDECPVIETHIVPSLDVPSGVGEPGLPPIAPAVANALFTLTGTRLRALPLRMPSEAAS